jgi:hypothetical protein
VPRSLHFLHGVQLLLKHRSEPVGDASKQARRPPRAQYRVRIRGRKVDAHDAAVVLLEAAAGCWGEVSSINRLSSSTSGARIEWRERGIVGRIVLYSSVNEDLEPLILIHLLNVLMRCAMPPCRDSTQGQVSRRLVAAKS